MRSYVLFWYANKWYIFLYSCGIIITIYYVKGRVCINWNICSISLCNTCNNYPSSYLLRTLVDYVLPPNNLACVMKIVNFKLLIIVITVWIYWSHFFIAMSSENLGEGRKCHPRILHCHSPLATCCLLSLVCHNALQLPAPCCHNMQ